VVITNKLPLRAETSSRLSQSPSPAASAAKPCHEVDTPEQVALLS
jgi:hypothetical protein